MKACSHPFSSSHRSSSFGALAAFLTISGLASAASAQAVDLGLGRRLGDPDGTAEPSSEEPAEPAEEEDLWTGPQIQLSYGYWKLADGYGGGDTHVAGFEVFVGWPISELRTGFLAEIGARDYSLGGDDLVVRGAVEIGFQLPGLLDPFVPHISVVGTGGVLVGERFETSVAYPLGGGGIELGATLRLVRNLHATISLSYIRLEMDGAGFDIFMFRAGVGL